MLFNVCEVGGTDGGVDIGGGEGGDGGGGLLGEALTVERCPCRNGTEE